MTADCRPATAPVGCDSQSSGCDPDECPGQRYLIRHSAGSAKTNSIAWLARRADSGRSASPVRREGRFKSMNLPYPYQKNVVSVKSGRWLSAVQPRDNFSSGARSSRSFSSALSCSCRTRSLESPISVAISRRVRTGLFSDFSPKRLNTI